MGAVSIVVYKLHASRLSTVMVGAEGGGLGGDGGSGLCCGASGARS